MNTEMLDLAERIQLLRSPDALSQHAQLLSHFDALKKFSVLPHDASKSVIVDIYGVVSVGNFLD